MSAVPTAQVKNPQEENEERNDLTEYSCASRKRGRTGSGNYFNDVGSPEAWNSAPE